MSHPSFYALPADSSAVRLLFFSTRQCLKTHSSSLRHSFWCFCLSPSLSLVSFGWGIVILQIQYICITIAPKVLFMWLRVLYLKNNYIFPPLLKTLYLKQPGKKLTSSRFFRPQTENHLLSGLEKTCRMYTNTVHTHSALPLHCLVLIAARQTHQTLWAPEGSCCH